MSPLAFAWRSLSREPARALLGTAGIAVVGALLFDMVLLSRGLLVSFRDLLRSTGYEVRVTATDALPGLGPPIAAAARAVADLRRLPELEEVVPVRFASVSARAPDGRWVEVAIIGSAPRKWGEWTVVSGDDLAASPPGEAPQAVVNREFARQLGLGPGSFVALRLRDDEDTVALPATTYRVAGIAEFPFDDAQGRTAAVTLVGFARLGLTPHADEADLLLVASRPEFGPEAAAAAVRRARPDLHAFSIEEFLDRFRHTDFSYFQQVSFVLSAITSFFSFLLVATLLTVSVNQRLGEVAALRALGFRRRRIVLHLVAESALLVGAGGLLALPLGWSLARVLDSILRGFPDLPARLHFFVLEPRAVILHAVLLGSTSLLAAAYPVSVAARLPIAATLRKESIS